MTLKKIEEKDLPSEKTKKRVKCEREKNRKTKEEEEKEKEDGCCSVNNGISASGVQIQTHRRRAYQPLPQVENQRPRFRGPSHSRNRRLQMGTLGFTWYISSFLPSSSFLYIFSGVFLFYFMVMFKAHFLIL